MTTDMNISIDSIKDHNTNGIRETIETNTEANVQVSPNNLPKKKSGVSDQRNEQSMSDTSIKTDSELKYPATSSVPSIDTDLPRKYSVTLKQVRDRVLRAIKKSKERNLFLDEDD